MPGLRRWTGALAGLLAGIVVLFAVRISPALFGLENLFYDAATRLVSRDRRPDPRILIAAISETTIHALEQQYGRWPYSRAVMALVVEELQASGARVIVFDQLFAERNFADEGDAQFAGALAQAPTVIAAQTEFRDRPFEVSSQYDRHLWTISGTQADRAFTLIAPHEAFASASAIGTIRLGLGDASSITRRFTLADPVGQGLHVPSLALAAVGIRENLPRQGTVADGVFRSGPLRVPVDAALSFPILWHTSARSPAEQSGPNTVELVYPSQNFERIVAAALFRDDPSQQEYSTAQLDAFRSQFKDKIVLIGLTAAGLLDLRPTPLNARTAGVEIYAHAIDNLINRQFNRDVPEFLQLALLMVLPVLFGLIVHLIRSQTISFLALAVTLALIFGGSILLLETGWILRSMAPATAIVAGYTAITAIKLMAEQRQSLQLRTTFGRYVSPQVLIYLLAHPEKVTLGGERRDLTILFSDIRGFTSISEASQPEEVVEMLNEYLTRMVEILLRHGGTLDKFIGDAVMGFWNAPTDDPDHAYHAVACAVEMIDETARLRAQWESEGKAPIRIGIGINTGEAVVGNIGSRQVFGYTVIGDAVNLASRLESKNKDYGTEIIISEFTLVRIGDRIPANYLDEVKVKGKDQAVKIYEVKGSQ